MTATVQRTTVCKMGNEPRVAWDVMVDGEPTAQVYRQWHAKAIADAVNAGHITTQGSMTMALDNWAASNDRALFERLCRLPADSLGA